VALDGESALEMLLEEQIDLVLLDIQMPGIDGYETCRRLKSQPDIADIPVVFITAETTATAIDKAYELGAVDYISKPFKPREVEVRVYNHLSLQALTQQLRGLGAFGP
jgi:CheY-like chemotaxis protein